MTWRNWVGDQTCEPMEMSFPRGAEDVQKVIRSAAHRGLKVRVAGAGHSFSEAVLTDGIMMNLDHMNRLLEVDREAKTVRVEAGIRLRTLNEALARQGLALPNLGDIDVQSLAGATATGTHGTGARFQNISAQIAAIQLVSGDGSIVELNEVTEPDALKAARVSIGALGVVTEMTLRVVPAFTLRAIDTTGPFDDVLASFDDLAERNEHFEFYLWPHSDRAWTRTNNRVDRAPILRSRARAWFEDELLVNSAFGAVCRIGRRFPRSIPSLHRLSTAVIGTTELVDESFRIFASQRRVRFTESEYSIPAEHATEAVRAVRTLTRRKDLDIMFPVEIRRVAPDDAFLSPASGRATCSISAHAFEGMEWRAYFDAFEDIMGGFDGRPHWGKRHSRTAADLRKLYPEWDRFLAVRDRFDPGRVFTNGYLERVLGD